MMALGIAFVTIMLALGNLELLGCPQMAVYFPMFQEWKFFEMPVPGYLGFPLVALECFVMYVSASSLLGWKTP